MTLRYDPTAAHGLLDAQLLDGIESDLLAARDAVFADVEMLNSGTAIPADKRPLDAGFIELPAQLLTAASAGDDSLLGRIESVGAQLRSEIDRLLVLGIGGSYMGTRALFEALCHPFHNELSRAARDGVPRLYFEGNNIDNDAVSGLLTMLENDCRDATDVEQKWGIVVVSKSGGTLETAVAFRLFRTALEKYYGADSAESRRFVIPITGETGILRDLSNVKKYESVFPIPDGVGGRFSVFTAVGLVPAAILGLDVRQLLQGAADATETFRTAAIGENPVLDYVRTCHLFEKHRGQNIRVLSTWGKRLEAVGLWYDQLLAESLGKEERGATPLTVVNTRDLHSRGQQHQEGTPDKLITNVIVDETASTPIVLPELSDDDDQLNQLSGKTLPVMLSAAINGTNKAYADVNRPTADLRLDRLDEYHLGQLLQMLMLATVVEGRLIDINPYGQPGVEAYKTNMNEFLGR